MKTMPRPKRHVTNRERGVTNGRATADAPVQTISSAVPPFSTTPGTPQTESQTQAADRLFLRRVEKIVGAQTMRRAGGEIYQLAYDVEVPNLWSEAADQVYTLRGDVHRKYPDAQIEIEVRGRRECGETASSVEQDEVP